MERQFSDCEHLHLLSRDIIFMSNYCYHLGDFEIDQVTKK